MADIDQFSGQLSSVVDLRTRACADQVSYLATYNLWPTGIKMLDAWGKIPDGILSGQFVSLGHFDQCVRISENTPVGTIKGKYCLLKFLNLMNNFAGHGICVPEVCDPKIPMMSVDCQTKESYATFDEADWFVLFLFGLLALVLLLSTLYDCFTRKFALKQNPFYLIFSLVTNGEKVLETRIAPDQISCMAGLRVLFLIWSISTHRYYVYLFLPSRNGVDSFHWAFSHKSIYIQGAYLAVDTFLYIGGFVLAYQCFKFRNSLALTVKTIPYFYMHRLLRLVPPMTVAFFIHITLIRRMGSGPLYPYLVEKMRAPCVDHWWSYFMFYQNYGYSKLTQTECLPHTWYINADLQLYLLAPFLIIPATKYLQKNQKFKCYSMFFMVLLISIFIPMLILLFTPYKYQHTHHRISTYIIGLMMGLFLIENKDKIFKIPKKLYVFVWILTIVTMCCCCYFVVNTQIYLRDRFNTAMLITIGRPAWALCISWIVFCCSTGNAYYLNKFLSNPFFIVVGRLTYSMYIFQVLVLVIVMGSERTLNHIGFWPILHANVSDIVLIIIVSIVSVLSFESPIIALTKLLLTRREPQFAKLR